MLPLKLLLSCPVKGCHQQQALLTFALASLSPDRGLVRVLI